ncbi:MAG: DUF4386 domain-containing protein [Kineosporiaceae bacterium]
MSATFGRRPVTGGLLVASALLSVLGYVVLGTQFDWPGVLDEPGTSALDKYVAAEQAIRAGFSVMALASLALIPAAFGLQAATARDHTAARVVTAFGVLGAFAQLLGWLRWPITMPSVAEAWTAAQGDPVAETAVATSYNVLNNYAGGALGEHLGWLLQGVWAVGIFAIAWRAVGVPQWVAGIGLLLSAVWGVAVPVATAVGADVLEFWALSVYTAWYVWLLVFGVVLVVRRVGAPEPDGVRS